MSSTHSCTRMCRQTYTCVYRLYMHIQNVIHYHFFIIYYTFLLKYFPVIKSIGFFFLLLLIISSFRLLHFSVLYLFLLKFQVTCEIISFVMELLCMYVIIFFVLIGFLSPGTLILFWLVPSFLQIVPPCILFTLFPPLLRIPFAALT